MSQAQNDQLIIIDNGEGDEPLSTRKMNPLFSSILEARLARRQVLKGSAGAAALGFFGLGLAGCKSSSSDDGDEPGSPAELIGFSAVAVNSEDKITVPEGYSYQVLIPWGTPIIGGVTRALADSGADQADRLAP